MYCCCVSIIFVNDTQQQYIKLNIHGEESIIVVQAHSDRKRDTPVYAHKRTHTYSHIYNDEKLWVSCPIFPSILIAKYLLTGSLKNRSIDNLETQKKYISMKNYQ
jgi:hypothetical protein